MTKRFRCTTHYAGDGSVTMISCVMIDVPDEEAPAEAEEEGIEDDIVDDPPATFSLRQRR